MKYDNCDNIKILDEDIANIYLEEIKSLTSKKSDLNIIYTPLHGVAGEITKKAMEDLGYNVKVVKEQYEPDGKFPTIDCANPEKKNLLIWRLNI